MIITNESAERALPIGQFALFARDALQEGMPGGFSSTPRVNHAIAVDDQRQVYRMKTISGGTPSLHIHRYATGVMEVHEEAGVVKRSRSRGASECGLIIATDPRTGSVKCILQDYYIAGACHAVSIGLCASWSMGSAGVRVALLGIGRQARFQIQSLAAIANITQVKVFAPRAVDAERMASQINVELFDGRDSLATPVSTIDGAVQDADVVLLATSSFEPIQIRSATLSSRVFISATRSRELPVEVVESADVLIQPTAVARCDSTDGSRVARDSLVRNRVSSSLGKVRDFLEFSRDTEFHRASQAPMRFVYAGGEGAENPMLLWLAVNAIMQTSSIPEGFSWEINQGRPS